MSDKNLEYTPEFDEFGNPEGVAEMEADVDPDGSADTDAYDSDGIEPGAEGQEGTGTEGADDWLEEGRLQTADQIADSDVGYEDEYGQDDTAAGEQGNRDGDEMVSEGDDRSELDELDGDAWDIDAAGEAHGDEQSDGPVADLTGDDDGEDPLAGGEPA